MDFQFFGGHSVEENKVSTNDARSSDWGVKSTRAIER